MRLTLEEQYLQIAKIIALRGSCKRLQVGCVITVDNRIVSSGYNGPLKSEPACDYETHKPDLTFCKTTYCEKAVHAEANAIYAAAKRGIALNGGTIWCTHSPCRNCVEAIVQSGLRHIWFVELYRDETPLESLRGKGISIHQLILDTKGLRQEYRRWLN